MLRKLIDDLLLKNSFTKNVLKVFSGSAVASIIAFFTLPIITRLYSPEDYGVFQLMLSFITLFYSISSLKYEMAIVLPTSAKKSRTITQLALMVLIGTTTVFSLALFFGGDFILGLLNAEKLSPYLMYMAVGVFLGGMIEIFRYTLTAKKQFKHQSICVVSQAGTNQSAAIGLGYLAPSFFGLILSFIAGQLVFISLYLFKNRLPVKGVNFEEIKESAVEYKNFPMINTISVFLNRLSLQLPVFMFSAYFTEEIVGIYNLAYKSISLPLTFLSYAISQVYLKDAAVAFAKSAETLLKLYKSLIFRVSILGLLPVLVITLFAQELVGIIFGSEWIQSAVFMQVMIFWIYFQFVNGSVATTISIINKQQYGLFLIIGSLALRFSAMYIFREDVMHMLYALTASAIIFYILYNFTIYILIKREKTI